MGFILMKNLMIIYWMWGVENLSSDSYTVLVEFFYFLIEALS